MKKIDITLLRIIGSGILFGVAFFVSVKVQWILYLLAYLLVGYDVIEKAIKGIFHGEFFDEAFLMTLATVGALMIREFPEAVAVMLFYQLGEWTFDKAIDKSKDSIMSLMDFRSDTAWLEKGNDFVKVDPETVPVGSIILVQPGERVPLDGVVIEGSSTLDTSSLTGESIPREVHVGDTVFSGVINLDGSFQLKTTTLSSESTVSRILDLMEHASEKKAPTERFITRFSKIYTPVVVILAVLLFLIPVFLFHQDMGTWFYRALVFLVISCPCALVISIPLGFFCGIGVASKYGILMKGSNELEKLKHVSTVVFDKTGTLTKGNFSITSIHGKKKEQVLMYAAYLEASSSHPIAVSIRNAYGKKVDKRKLKNVKEVSGNGVVATLDGVKMILGKSNFLKEQGITLPNVKEVGTVIYLAVDGAYYGHLVIRDEVKEDAKEALLLLQKEGVKRFVLLSGDHKDIVSHVAQEVGILEFYSNLLPVDKVHQLEGIRQEEVDYVLFVGDGMNDAPVLMSADIGVSMGGIGSDAAIEASDIVLMDDSLTKIALSIIIAKRTNRIVWQNIFFAIGVKILFLLLGALGIASIWFAVFADVGVTILAILNALRILYHAYEKDM